MICSHSQNTLKHTVYLKRDDSMKKKKNIVSTILIIIITATVGVLSSLLDLTKTITIIGSICLLLFILYLIIFLITKKIHKYELSDVETKWNKMWDLWMAQKAESPYAELMTYHSEVMNGGHVQYFINLRNTKDLKKEISTMKKILPPHIYDNLNNAYKAHIRLEKELNIKKEVTKEEFIKEEILDNFDNYFYHNEQEIIKILEEYASKLEIEKNIKEE